MEPPLQVTFHMVYPLTLPETPQDPTQLGTNYIQLAGRVKKGWLRDLSIQWPSCHHLLWGKNMSKILGVSYWLEITTLMGIIITALHRAQRSTTGPSMVCVCSDILKQEVPITDSELTVCLGHVCASLPTVCQGLVQIYSPRMFWVILLCFGSFVVINIEITMEPSRRMVSRPRLWRLLTELVLDREEEMLWRSR